MKATQLARPEKAFTMVELLVTVAIIGALAAMLIPQIKSQIERSKAVLCTGHLQQISSIFHTYAAEHNMRIGFMRDGPTSRQWYSELQKQANLSDLEAQKTFGCPSIPWQSVTSWSCYGFRSGPFPPIASDPGKVVRPNGAGGTSYYEFSLAAIQEPSRFFIMGDTGTPSNLQTFRIIPPQLYSATGLKIRHQNRANILFLDGHVEALDRNALKELGFTQVLNSDGQPTSTGP